jgi:uncharacterized tellurite resistance protein B-like protein
MLYVGRGLADVTGSGIEPALINPNLKVRFPTGPVDQMPYWPSYSTISAEARGGYLQWLAGGRKNPSVQIGYVFLFFYGLERRVLVDSRQYTGVKEEFPIILEEIKRLLSIYGSSSSFYGYAQRFIDLIETVDTQEKVYQLPPPPQGQYKAVTMRHKIALAQAAVDGASLPAEWAYSWSINDERVFMRTPATRCPDQFKKLFLSYYTEEFDNGFKLPVNKTKLKGLYRAASASFGYSHIQLTLADLPDITVLEGPLNKLKAIAERATLQLEPYSRYLGRNPNKQDEVGGYLLLPPQLWPDEKVQRLKAWLTRLWADHSIQATTLQALAHQIPLPQDLTKDQMMALASALEQLGVGLEPDVRWGGPLPKEKSNIVLFPIPDGEKAAKPSALYSAAALTLHLAVGVTAADGKVSDLESEHLEERLEKWLHLSSSDRTRLRAHLKWLLHEPPGLTALKKRTSNLNEEQKRGMATFLIDVAQTDGGVSAEEVKTLAKVFRLFGFEEKELYSQIHSATTEPVTVKPAAPGGQGFGVPPKPTAKPSGGPALDQDRIAALKADSERVAAMLGAIFVDEAAQEPAPPPEVEVIKESSISGLDAAHSELVRMLISRDAWTRSELEDLASDRGMMLDGALERINEAFLDAHSEPLLEGEDPVDINKNIAKELKAA